MARIVHNTQSLHAYHAQNIYKDLQRNKLAYVISASSFLHWWCMSEWVNITVREPDSPTLFRSVRRRS